MAAFLTLFTLLLSAFFSPVDSFADPKTIQLDVIFPQNNTVYKPPYPFPVVFAVQNATAAKSPAYLTLSWALYGGNPERLVDVEIIPLGADLVNVTDELLFINYTKNIDNDTYDNFTLNYVFYFGHVCGFYPGLWQEGNLYFNLSDNGITPSIDGPCATGLTTIGIQGYGTKDNGTCPIVSQEQQPPIKPCAFEIDSTVASRVNESMLAAADCTSGSWPSIAGPGECDPSRNMANSSNLGAAIVILVAGLIGFACVLT